MVKVEPLRIHFGPYKAIVLFDDFFAIARPRPVPP